MTDKTQLLRHAKGNRPQFYETKGLDEAMSMILVLATEMATMRDRMDSFEEIAAQKGVLLSEEIERFTPSEASLKRRELRRQNFLKRLYYVTTKNSQEQAQNDSPERYSDALHEIAKG